MNDRQKEPISPVIVDLFTNTLLPFFSWLVGQFSGIMLGCKLTLVLRYPDSAYKRVVRESWVEGDDLFSPAEILAFQTASGRRRARKKLKKRFAPFFREMNRSPECLLFKQRFQEKLNRLREAVSDETPHKIPPKARIEIDIAEREEGMSRLLSHSRDDIVSAFPVGSTLADDNLRKRVASEVDDYPQTMRSLLWEASLDWNLLRQVQERRREDSKFRKILGFDPNDEPHLEKLFDWCLDLALGQVNEDKVMYLARWFMDRVLVSQFILYPYSDKRFRSYTGLEQAEGEENNLPLSDEDRLSEFYELAGVEISTLTAGESSRMLDIFHALDLGYDFAAKQGMSMQAYYGTRADSEKTQRQRLFKKLREARGKAK